jgi:hypothetical protein
MLLFKYLTSYTGYLYPNPTNIENASGDFRFLVRRSWLPAQNGAGFMADFFEIELQATSQTNLETMIDKFLGFNAGGDDNDWYSSNPVTITGTIAAAADDRGLIVGNPAIPPFVVSNLTADDVVMQLLDAGNIGMFRFTLSNAITSTYYTYYTPQDATLTFFVPNTYGSATATASLTLLSASNPGAPATYDDTTLVLLSTTPVGTTLLNNASIPIDIKTLISDYLTGLSAATSYINVVIWETHAEGPSIRNRDAGDSNPTEYATLTIHLKLRGPYWINLTKQYQIDEDAIHKAIIRCEARWIV